MAGLREEGLASNGSGDGVLVILIPATAAKLEAGLEGRSEYRRRGFATDAAQALVERAFSVPVVAWPSRNQLMPARGQ